MEDTLVSKVVKADGGQLKATMAQKIWIAIQDMEFKLVGGTCKGKQSSR